MSILHRLKYLTAIALVAAVLATCAVNPVTGRRELALISEAQEIEMGRQYSAEVVASLGLIPDEALQSYVRNLGLALAKDSQRPNLPWEFHAIEDPAVNAFALPGGFIFVTRGLLSHMVNEAELVTVIGHEIGHVTARHSVQQMSRTQLAQIGLGVGSILSSTVAEYGQIASAGLGVMFLKFGREDELQADQLGFAYALDAGYDVREMVKMFEMLQAQAAMGGGGKLPEWQSTHPDPGNRIRATQDRLASVTTDLGNSKVGAADFLNRINGMVFGENPRHGYFQENLFLHPDLRFRFAFPAGWQKQNQPSAVVAVSGAQDAMVELRIATGSAAEASQAFFSQQGLQASRVTRTSINGLPATTGEFVAATEQGSLSGMAAFVENGGATYRLLAYTPSTKLPSYEAIFRSALMSFSVLTDQAALNIQPKRIRIERLPRAMTLAQFNQQFPSAISLEQLAVINGVSTTEQIPSGSQLKRVVQ